MLIKYVKDLRDRPIGVVVAYAENGLLHMGWSYCSAPDVFDKKKGVEIAKARAAAGYMRLPLQKPVLLSRRWAIRGDDCVFFDDASENDFELASLPCRSCGAHTVAQTFEYIKGIAHKRFGTTQMFQATRQKTKVTTKTPPTR